MILIRHSFITIFAFSCAGLSVVAYAKSFQLESKEQLSISIIEEFQVSTTESGKDINFEGNESYKIYEPSTIDPFLSLMRYFYAGSNRDKQALFRLGTEEQNNYLEAIDKEKYEIQLGSFKGIVNNWIVKLGQKFEVQGMDVVFYRLEIKFNESAEAIYLPFAVTKVGGIWLFDGGFGLEMGTVIRKQYPFTEKIYRVGKYPSRNRLHGY